VSHQHVDFVFYGAVDGRDIGPVGDEEAAPEQWEWFTAEELAANADRLESDVVELGREAIETVED
jgi:hypothetical protein